MQIEEKIRALVAGRTDLVAELLADGVPPDATDSGGVSLMQWCAYHGDVTALRLLVSAGISLGTLGDNLDLNGAAFHGYPGLCEYLIQAGADPDYPMPGTAEVPLHAALCKRDRASTSQVVNVLLAAGANVNAKTTAGNESGCFMRDVRTRGESVLHRAAAFGSLQVITTLIRAGADKESRDANGDSPLTWASWHLRSPRVLDVLCFGPHHIHPEAVKADETDGF